MSEQQEFNKDEFPYLDAFISSAVDVLRTHTAQDVEFLNAERKTGLQAQGDVIAMMSFAGRVRGYLVIGCSRALATQLVAALLGISGDTLTTERLRDGVCEILNMIAGNAKSRLANSADHFDMTTPGAVVGVGCAFDQKSAAPKIVLRFSIMDDVFNLEVTLKRLA